MGLPAADPLADAHADRSPTGWCSTTSSPTCTAGSSWTIRAATRRRSAAAYTRYLGITNYNDYLVGDRADPNCLFNQQSLLQPDDRVQQPLADRHLPDRAVTPGSEVGRHVLPDQHARRRPQPEVRRRLAQEPDHDVLALQRRRARAAAVRRQQPQQLRQRRDGAGGRGGRLRRAFRPCSTATSC